MRESVEGKASLGRLDRSRDLAAFVASIRSSRPVAGLTHAFYRYPGRFSPEFARGAISLFSRPESTVLDPFMGGGTTAVEALSMGRRFVGVDLNPLGVFVAKVKTTPLSPNDYEDLLNWTLRPRISSGGATPAASKLDAGEYPLHMPWWLRRPISELVASINELSSDRQRDFALCSVLRTAQWALDCRRRLPNTRAFLAKHRAILSEMVQGGRDFSAGIQHSWGQAASVGEMRRLLLRTAEGIDRDCRVPSAWKPVDLVVTSPPYLGVHVLYHRWQVQSRRETPAPFWIAGLDDGHSGSYYTFGGRHLKHPTRYLEILRKSFESAVKVLREGGFVVQLVGFADPQAQLPPYLEVLAKLGLEETSAYGGESRARAWRVVPNRRWYADIGVASKSSKEVLLIHKKVVS